MSDKNPLLYEVHVEQSGKKRPSVNAYYDEDIAVAAAEKATRPAKLYSIQEDMDDESGEIIETEVRLRTYSKGSMIADQAYEKVRSKMDNLDVEATAANYTEQMAKKGKSGKAAPTPEEIEAKAKAKADKLAEREARKAARAAAKAERDAAKAARGEGRKRLFHADTILHVVGTSGHGARAGSNRDQRYSQIKDGMKFSEYSSLVKKGKAGRDVNNLIIKGYLTVTEPTVAEASAEAPVADAAS